MGNPVGTTACPGCRAKGRDRSGDNLVLYDNDSAHCFACGYDKQPGKQARIEHEDMMGDLSMKDVSRLPIKALDVRGINEATAKLFGVRTEIDPESGLDAAYYFPLYKGGTLTGFQRKTAKAPGTRGKGDVKRVGDTKETIPFGGQNSASGQMIIVVEGAEDALAASQMLAAKGKKYRVVATLGTDGWQANMGYFEGFEKVVIAYDQDGAGKDAARQFAEALSPGKARLMRWSGASDPNALLLMEQGADRFYSAISNAEPHRPDGIITGEEVWQRMADYVEPAFVPYPEDWQMLQAKTGGVREAEITMLTGGSSVGKTAYTRRIKDHILTNTDWSIGEVELEERSEKTWRGLMQSHAGKRWADMTPEERRFAYEETYGTRRIFTLDHRSQYGKGQSLVSKFKHLHYNNGCKALFLDHVTLAVNEFGDGVGNPAQDQMMNEFLELVETTGIHLFLISHLRKTGQGGKSFEEGAVPTMDDLKGSGSLKQISFNIIGVSRNLQHEDPYERNVSQLHVMKCRETGDTGRADRLYWDNDTQGLVPAREPIAEGEDEGQDRSF